MMRTVAKSRCLSRKAVSLLLSFCLLSTDPIWAAVAVNFRQGRAPAQLDFASQAFDRQALVSRLAASVFRPDSLRNSRTLATLVLLGSIFVAAPFAEPQSAPSKRPPVARLPVPEGPFIHRENILLTEEQWKGAWHLAPDMAQARKLSQLLQQVIHANPRVSAKFYEHRAAWQALLGIQLGEDKYFQMGLDRLHAPGVAFVGPQSTIGQAILFPGLSVASPKRQTQILGSTAEDEGGGRSFWRRLADGAMKILSGVQWVSKNTVEAEYLREHAQAFEIYKAYADLAQTVQEAHADALRSALAYRIEAERLREMGYEAGISRFVENREKGSVSQEGRSPARLLELARDAEKSAADLASAHGALERLRVRWLGAVADSEQALAGAAASPLHPERVSWRMDASLLERSGLVPGVLREEGAPFNVPHLSTLPSHQAIQAAEAAYHPPALDGFPPGTTGSETDGIPPTEADLDRIFSPVPADRPLGKSPLERRLELQKEMLEVVTKRLLELKKEPTWRAGVHLSLGSLPFIASLLNYDVQVPDRSTRRSLDEWIVEASLRQRVIDDQIQEERARVRGEFLLARAQRQNAWVQLAATRNRIALAERQWLAAVQADTRRVAADRDLLWLRLQQLRQEYMRHLEAAHAAARLMELYTMEYQDELQAALAEHYMAVIARIDPSSPSTPNPVNPPGPQAPTPVKKSAARTIRWILPPTLMTVLGMIFPSAASAHTFSAHPVAAAAKVAGQVMNGGPLADIAQKVAVDVTVGHYQTGHSANTLWGIAVDILKKQHPGKALSGREINDLVASITQENGISNPDLIQPGALHVGSYDPEIARGLDPSFSAGPSAPAAVPQPAAATPVSQAGVPPSFAEAPSVSPPMTQLPVSNVSPPPAVSMQPQPSDAGFDTTGSGSIFSNWTEAIHHMSGWIFQDAWHMALVAGGIFLLVVAVLAIRHYWKSGKIPREAAPASHPNGNSKNGKNLLPWILIPLTAAVLIRSTLNVIPWMSYVAILAAHPRWLQGAAMVLGAASFISLVPTLGVGNRRRLYGLGVASVVSWVCSPMPWLSLVPLFVMLWGSIEFLGRTPVSRDRRWFLGAAGLAALSFLLPFRGQEAAATSPEPPGRAEPQTLRQMASVNNGVGVQPVRIPVTWAPPEAGVVTQVKLHRSETFQKGGPRLFVAYDPLDASLHRRLEQVSRNLRDLDGTDVVASGRLRSAADPHADALIRVRANPESSVDHAIHLVLNEIEGLHERYLNARALSAQTAAETGQPAESFEEQSLRHTLRERGLHLNALLLKREQRNIPFNPELLDANQKVGGKGAVSTIHILLEAGVLTEGTDLKAGVPVALFTQEFPNHRHLQLRLTPLDAFALEQAWQRSKETTFLHIVGPDQNELPIPLKDIVEFVRPGDPNFVQETRRENYSGPELTNPAMGRDAILSVELIVRVPNDDLGSGAYQFRGLHDDKGNRLIETPQNVTLGYATILPGNPTHPPYSALLRPLQEQYEATARLEVSLRTLKASVEQHRQAYPQSEWGVEFLERLNAQLGRLETRKAELSRSIQNVEQSGGSAKGSRVQPAESFRYNHYPLARRHPNYPGEDALVPLGPNVRVRVSFYAQAQNLSLKDKVGVRSAALPVPVDFEIVGSKSLDRLYDLYEFQAERTLPLAEAQKLFPPGLPMTRSLVRIDLGRSGARSSLYRLIGRLIGAPTPSEGLLAGSQLKGGRLTVAAAVTLGLSLASYAAGGGWHAGSLAAGYALSVGVHELGHGLTAWRQGRWAVPWLSIRSGQRGITWWERRSNQWRILINPEVRRAGPLFSDWVLRLSIPFLFVLLIYPSAPFVALAVSGLAASAIFRKADYSSPLPAGDGSVSGTFQMPLPSDLEEVPQPSGLAVVSQPAPSTRQSANQLEQFARALKTTTLEYEVYWHQGQQRSYLTPVQKMTSLWKKKIKLTERMRLYRRFQRNGVSRWQAFLLDEHYQMPTQEAAAGSKTRTFFWVLVILGGMVGLWLRSPADTREEALRVFLTHPMMAPFLSNPLAGAAAFAFGFLIAGWLVIAIAEGWGKLIATTWWNLYHRFFLQTLLGGNSKNLFEAQTGRNAMAELKRIYESTVLYPNNKLEYEPFMEAYFGFARQIADAAHRQLVAADADAAKAAPNGVYPLSDKTRTFLNAFRVQLRRSRSLHFPIYPSTPRPLAADEEHFKMLREKKNIDVEALTKEQRYEHLEWARAEEAKSLMLDFPSHTLIALLRSGNAEMIANINGMENAGLVRQALDALQERLPSLDPDAFGGFRAQERAGEVFDLLHYVFEGLHDPFWRKQIIRYWELAVGPYEQATWTEFLEKLPDLLSTTDVKTGNKKNPEALAGDHNIVRTVGYALTLRGTKEWVEASAALLKDLREWRPHTPEVTLRDRYNRNEQGQPTTSVLQLKMAYEKGYDLLSELISWFPGEPILGDRDVYLTCENTVNFRQATREIGFWLQLTRGRVIMVDAGKTHPKFFSFLKDNIPGRLPRRFAHRVRFMALEDMNPHSKIMRDRDAFIVSSATPGDWLFLRQAAGTRVHVPSEFLNPMAALVGIRELSQPPVEALIKAKQQALGEEFQPLMQRRRALEQELGNGWRELTRTGLDFVTAPPEGPWLLGRLWKLLRRGLPLKRLESDLEAKREELNRIKASQNDLSRKFYELERLKREMVNLDYFLGDIGIRTGSYTEGEGATPPTIDPDHILDGRFSLKDLFTLHPRSPAGESGLREPPPSGGLGASAPSFPPPSGPDQQHIRPLRRGLLASA